MEIVGGFMVMMSIIGLFLAVIWLIMPFVVFAIKGKQDRTLEVLEAVEKRLAAIETVLKSTEYAKSSAADNNCCNKEVQQSVENAEIKAVACSDDSVTSPVV